MSDGQVGARLGTFLGVFLPCLLTILGVILFLRLGWIVGHLGLIETWVLITLATSITFLTGLSVSAIATNMKVGGGGSYYMISRSLGLEVGGAVGLPLYLGKTLGVAFYLLGFAESLQMLLPGYSAPLIASISLVVLAALSLYSTRLAARSQLPVFGMILLSLGALALGGPPEDGFVTPTESSTEVTFFIAFAVFFPAVTGIEAGVGLSGSLRNPEHAIPIGSLGAIAVSYLIYMAVPLLLIAWVPPSVLVDDELVMQRLMPHEGFFYCGIWGAALSSALVNLLAGPHMLQQLARDRVLPAFLGRGKPGDDTPRVATLLTLAIILVALWSGGLNSIAKALSVFFLATYGILNFAAAVEAWLDNPSWRPTFNVRWWVSALGAVGSFTVMFVLTPSASAAALLVCLSIYLWLSHRHLGRRWTDVRTGAWLFLLRTLLYRLRDYQPDVRNWRPNMLVFTGAPTRRWYLVELANALSQNRGLLTLATLLRHDQADEQVELLREGLGQLFEKRKIAALSRVHRTHNLRAGMGEMIRYYGFGPLRPNTVMFAHDYQFDEAHDLVALIQDSYSDGLNVIVVREGSSGEMQGPPRRALHLWWGGHKSNLGFMLAIAHLIRHSEVWGGLSIEIQCDGPTLREGDNPSAFSDNLREMLAHARIHATIHFVHREAGESLGQLMQRVSGDAEIVLLGMRAPEPGESLDVYTSYYRTLESQLPNASLVIQAMAAEDLPFFDLFR